MTFEWKVNLAIVLSAISMLLTVVFRLIDAAGRRKAERIQEYLDQQ